VAKVGTRVGLVFVVDEWGGVGLVVRPGRVWCGSATGGLAGGMRGVAPTGPGSATISGMHLQRSCTSHRLPLGPPPQTALDSNDRVPGDLFPTFSCSHIHLADSTVMPHIHLPIPA